MLRPIFPAFLLCLGLVSAGWSPSLAQSTVEPAQGEAIATHWPGLLGPRRDGWVSNFSPPREWPEKLVRKWRVEVGTGYGTPLVVAERVYQHSRQGEEEVVRCLDLKTGKELWSKSDATPFKIGGGGERHGKGPKSCPTIADGRLFTLSIAGVLTAWDAASGDLLWRREYQQEFGGGHPYWGASTSPLVVGDQVVVHFGRDEKGALIALDVKSGAEAWRQGKDGPSYSSPLRVTLQGVEQIVEWNHRALLGVDPSNGRLLWEHPFPHVGHNQNMPTPAVHDGKILLGGENRGVHCLQPMLKGGQWSVVQHWQQEKVALDMSTAVVNGDRLFGMSHYGKGRMFCVDIATGEIRWQGPGRVGENVAFLSIPGHVVGLTSHGQLHVVRATDKAYQPVATYDVDDRWTWAPPVLLPHGLLVKGESNLTYWTLPQAN